MTIPSDKMEASASRSASMAMARQYSKQSLNFSEDPDLFLKEFKHSEEACMNQLFQELLRKEQSEKGKLRLLLLVQEQIDLINNNYENVKKLLEILQNCYKLLISKSKKSNKNYLLESQILVTWTTTLILATDKHNTVSELKSSFVALFDELIQVILNINNSDNCVIRSVSCDCLIELEIAFPQLLSSMLETLKDVYIQEVTFLHYKYALLLSIAAKHEYTVIKDPFSISQMIISEVISTQSNSQTLLMSPSISSLQEKQLVSLLMEHLAFLNNHQGSLIVRNIADLIFINRSVAPSILKSFVLQYKKTFDINLLHLICQLQMMFKDELFNEEIEQQILIHIFHLAHLPLLSSAQRLLYLDWLQHYAVHEEKEEMNEMKLDFSFALKFCPSIFDGWETSTKKFLIIATLLVENGNQDSYNANGEMLWRFITCASHVASINMCRRAAVSVFRFLLIFLKNFGKYFYPEIIKFITDFFQNHSSYVYNIINFINCVSKDELHIDGNFIHNLWQSLVQFILESTESLNFDTITDYFILLNEVAKNSSCRYCVRVVNFLLELTKTNFCESSSWILGNQILQICQSLLRHRDCNDIFTDLSDVLYILYTKYNDADVRDNARLLFMILMSLSTQRIQSMFNYEIGSTYQSHGNISSALVSELGSFGLTARIVALKESPIELIKMNEKINNEFVEMCEESNEMPENILKTYRLHIGKEECKKQILIPCKLQYTSNMVKTKGFDKLFCIDIQFEHADWLDDIKSVTVPIIGQSHPENVVIDLRPTECKSVELNSNATFNTLNCGTFVCDLNPILLKFEDFFLPLPVPIQYLSHKSDWRCCVFNELWASFRKSADRGSAESDCQESVHVITMEDHKFLPILETKLLNFVIKNDDENRNTSQNIGIFLPPRHHVLLKLKIFPEKIIAEIMVDHWKFLSHLNEFLLSLENEDMHNL